MESTAAEKRWTILSLIQWSETYLAERGIESPRLNAELLLARVLGMQRLDLYTRFDKPLIDDELARYKSLFLRRLKREPLQYILGYVDFYGRRFQVKPGVLIPRPETEHIIEATIDLLKEREIPSQRIIDIGTGSGCIAITLTAEIPTATVTAVDISDDAVYLAGVNAENYSVHDRINIRKLNILDPFVAIPDAGTYDVIVSNPPYISYSEWEKLPDEIKVHEPKVALTDGGDGLAYIRRLSELAPDVLKKGGWLICEIGYDQFDSVEKIFTSAGLHEIRYWKDLNGIRRIIGGIW
jgi:release factor glutamine methyltransferase